MLTKVIKHNFSFNIMNAFKGIKEAVTAPVKHAKALYEPTGKHYSIQTNTTAEAFDQVSQQWQAHLGNNPFDLQTFNALQNAQLSNFGTVDNPLVVFTADAPYRFVGCSGPQHQDDYQSHQLFWLMLREGPLQRCAVCGQVFKLVRLRNQYSPEMDYYIPNFNKLWFEEMGEHDTTNILSIHKANTHYEHTLFEQPEDSVYSLVNGDDHDRILTDPAYRMQRQAQGELKSKIYLTAMEDYQMDKLAKSPYRQPISKTTWQNLIEAEAIMKKLDRSFRQVLKWESRKYVDPTQHERRESRMLQRSKQRWDGAYTVYTGNLSEQQQRYRDYFQTDLQQNREDERIEQFLDKQELLTNEKYSIRHFDFQQSYTIGPEDDQSSYVEKKAFKFKFRRALDSPADYQRRNKRMVQKQKSRFQQGGVQQLIQNYIRDPDNHQKAYLQFLESEGVRQYQDYFQTDKDQFELALLHESRNTLALVTQNWQIPKQDISGYKTFPLPQWNNQLGFWPNTVALLTELRKVPAASLQIESEATLESLSQSSLVKKE